MADIAAHTAASDAPRPRLSQAALVLLQTALAQKEHVFVGQSFEARPSRTPLVYGRHGVFAPALNDDDEGQGQTLSPLDYGDACSHAVVYGRDVSAAIIELAERNATSHGAVGAAGFVLSGAIIIGAIDLVNARAAFPIRIVNCFVPDGIVFHHGAFGSIDLDSSIVGPINAVLAKFDGSVRLAHAKFLGPVDFGAATVAKVLDLRDCVIAPARPLARGQSAPIDRALMNLSMSDIGEARFNGALICGGIVMLSAKVRGHVYFRDACVLSPEALCHAFAGPVADRFGRPVAKFSPARFAHAVTHGIEEIVADDAEALATIPSLISKLIATVSALERRVAALDQAEPLQPATSAEAFAAWIERFCQDSDVFPSALRAEAAVIGGSFSLRNATISGGVNLSNAQFDGGIRLDGAYLAWPLASPYDRPAILRAVHARVGERVEFHHDPGTRTQAGEFTPARILGTIDFSSLRVGGDANLSHTIFGSSVVLRGAEIGGALTFLRSVFALCGDAERAIDAQGVRVGGDIAWGVRAAHELADAATFSTAGERAPSAIVVTRADVGGDLLYPFAVSDHVAFLGRDLRVAGTIAFLPRQRSARAPQPPPRSPDALAHAWSEIIADQRAWSGGALIALALAACALAFARLDLALAAVGSWFGLRLLFASVRPIQRTWRLLTRVFGLGPSTQAPARRLEIDLMHARCSTFEAGFGAWPNPGSLVLEGLHFNSLGASGPFRQWPLPAAERHERRLTSVLLLAPRAWHRLWKLLAGRPLAGLRWLELQREAPGLVWPMTNYLPYQPFLEVARALRNAGLPLAADKVEIRGMQEMTRAQHIALQLPRVFLLEWLAGYGFRLWRLASVLILAIAMIASLMWAANAEGLVVRTQNEACPTPVFAATTDSAPAEPIAPANSRFNPMLNALDTVLPGVEFGVAECWMLQWDPNFARPPPQISHLEADNLQFWRNTIPDRRSRFEAYYHLRVVGIFVSWLVFTVFVWVIAARLQSAMQRNSPMP